MPALSYYNGQIVTPPDYMAAVSSYQLPPPPPPSVQPPAYQYGGYAQAPPPPPPYVKPDYQHQHTAAAGAYRRQPSRSQLFDRHASFSSNGTTFYLPQVPLDQAPPPQAPAAVAHAPPPQQHMIDRYNNGNPANVTGGVSANLDYNITEMASFLSSMASSIMQQPRNLPEFQKFCVQVLQATRLPRATVILSLVYLSKRWAMGSVPDSKVDPMATYKMLVVALLLANKFHDDNTFTNKSWNEATGLPVQELTAIEKQWLEMCKWSLHLNANELKGWTKWNDCWVMYTKDSRYNTMFNQPTPVTSAVSSPEMEKYRPSSYTIPKWYEMANSRPLSANSMSSAAAPEFSYFQQSYALPAPAPSSESGNQIGSRIGPALAVGSNLALSNSNMVPRAAAAGAFLPAIAPPQISSQGQAAPVVTQQQAQPLYMPYNNMGACNCSMCSFEPLIKQNSSAYHHHGYGHHSQHHHHHHHHHHSMNLPMNGYHHQQAPARPEIPAPVAWYGTSVAAC